MTAPTSSTTALALLRKLINDLAESDNPEGDAREITAAVLGYEPSALSLHYDEPVTDKQITEAERMSAQRKSGEPIQYIIGSWSFMGREYRVGRGVLIPRDDTEVVVCEALRLMKNAERPRIVDLCSGSGIIAVTLERELEGAEVYAVEKSREAYEYLMTNIRLNRSGVKALESDLKDCVNDFDYGSLNLIISNPPYIRSGELSGLQREVQYEPRLALDGGESGYDFYEVIIGLWSPKLKKGGCIALEIGEDQYETVAGMLRNNEYTEIRGYPDIQGITRAVTARK